MTYEKAKSVVWHRALISVMSIRVVMIGDVQVGGISHRLNQAEKPFGLNIIGIADSPVFLLLGAGCFGAALGN